MVEGEKLSAEWNTWIKLPLDTTGIIRIKTEIQNNLKGKLRKSLFKDCIYFMDYKFSDNTQKTCRIVRENAINGLWVSPFIERINNGLNGKRVESVRFHASKNELVTDSISFQWQIITLAENQHTAQHDK